MADTPTVERIKELLAEVYTEESARVWLGARNRNLGGRSPADLIRSGDAAQVLAEAQRLAGAM